MRFVFQVFCPVGIRSLLDCVAFEAAQCGGKVNKKSFKIYEKMTFLYFYYKKINIEINSKRHGFFLKS